MDKIFKKLKLINPSAEKIKKIYYCDIRIKNKYNIKIVCVNLDKLLKLCADIKRALHDVALAAIFLGDLFKTIGKRIRFTDMKIGGIGCCLIPLDETKYRNLKGKTILLSADDETRVYDLT